MQFIFQFSLPHSNRRIAIWCCCLQNCYKVLSKSTIFSIFFSPLNPCQSLQIGCSWSQKVSVSRGRVTTKFCNNMSHYFLQISLKIRRKKHCETNFFFPHPEPVASGGEVASLARDGNQQNLLITTPTNRWPRESNWWMNLSFFFLRKPPKHFYENQQLFDYHSYQQMAKGTQMMNQTPFLDETQKHLFANINKTFWSPEVLRYHILLLITVQFRLTFWKGGQVLGLWALYH